MKRLCALLLAATAFAVNAQTHPVAPLADLDGYVQATMAQWKVPGLALAVVKDGKVILVRGYGVRELGKPGKVDADTLFGIASNSKAFTAAALGTLVSSGKLRWDDPVTNYLPDFRLNDPYVTRALTVRDILSHRSGYCDPLFMWLTGDFTRTQIVHQLRFQKPDYGLRARFCYNNSMYLVAGQIVAAISGESWDDYVRTQFFVPLDMRHSSSHMAVFESDPDVAVPHGEIAGKAVPIARMQTDVMASVGGIKSSVADMSHWLLMLLANGRYHGHQILDPAVVKSMETPQMLIPADSEIGAWAHTQTPDSRFLSYGLGLFVQDYAGHTLLWHAGDINGMASATGLLPDAGLGIVVLSNMNQNRAPEAVLFHVLDAWLGRAPCDVSGALLALVQKEENSSKALDAKLAAMRVPDARPSLPLGDYAGVYHNELDGDVTVSLVNNHLVLAFGNPDFSATLIPWDHDTFQAPWHNPLYGDGYVSFDLDALARPRALGFAGVPDRFMRVPATHR